MVLTKTLLALALAAPALAFSPGFAPRVAGLVVPSDASGLTSRSGLASEARSVGSSVLPRRGSAVMYAGTTPPAAGKKRIVVLGGDGFCGWPTALHLSDEGHDVVIVDNLSRRNIDTELGCDSLTPIQPMEVRVAAWEELSGKKIDFVNMDVAKEYAELVELLKDYKPDTVGNTENTLAFFTGT